MKNLIGQIMAYQEGRMTRQEIRGFYQELIDHDMIEPMGQPYRRMARIFIERGECLPKERFCVETSAGWEQDADHGPRAARGSGCGTRVQMSHRASRRIGEPKLTWFDHWQRFCRRLALAQLWC